MTSTGDFVPKDGVSLPDDSEEPSPFRVAKSRHPPSLLPYTVPQIPEKGTSSPSPSSSPSSSSPSPSSSSPSPSSSSPSPSSPSSPSLSPSVGAPASSSACFPARPLPFDSELAKALVRRSDKHGGAFWTCRARLWSCKAREQERRGAAKKRRSGEKRDASSLSDDEVLLKCVNHLVLLRRVYGRGTYGKVTAALDLAAELRPLAIKTYLPHTLRRSRTATFGPSGPQFLTEWDKVRGEILIQCSLHHRHICPLYGVVDDKRRGECRLLLQLLPHALMTWNEGAQAFHVPSADRKDAKRLGTGKHNSEIRVYTEEAAREITAQLLDALDYLHSLRIVHKDVKPQNILAVSPPPAEWLVSLSLPLSPSSSPSSSFPPPTNHRSPSSVNRVSGFEEEAVSGNGLEAMKEAVACDSQEATEDDDFFFEKEDVKSIAVSPSFLTAAEVASGNISPYDAYFARLFRPEKSRDAPSRSPAESGEEWTEDAPSSSLSRWPSPANLSFSSPRKRRPGADLPSLVASSVSGPRKRTSDSVSTGDFPSLICRGQAMFERTVGGRRVLSLASTVFYGDDAFSGCRTKDISFSFRNSLDSRRQPGGERAQARAETEEAVRDQWGETKRGAGEAEQDEVDREERGRRLRTRTQDSHSDLAAYESFLSWKGSVNLDEERRKCVWKLVDFNTASVTADDRCTIWDSEGTRLFTPPECLGIAKEEGYDGRSRDLWSVGVCLYCLLLGRPPFFAGGDTGLALVAAIMSDDVTFPEYRHLSDDVKNLIRGLLSKDASTRLTSSQVRDHPWMKQPR